MRIVQISRLRVRPDLMGSRAWTSGLHPLLADGMSFVMSRAVRVEVADDDTNHDGSVRCRRHHAPRKGAPHGGFGALTSRPDRAKKAAIPLNQRLSNLARRRGLPWFGRVVAPAFPSDVPTPGRSIRKAASWVVAPDYARLDWSTHPLKPHQVAARRAPDRSTTSGK